MNKLKYTTEEISQYFKEQNCELLDEYLGTYSPMDYKCSCGSYGTTTWNNFSKGKRCGNCAKGGLCKKRSLKQVQEIFHQRGCDFLDFEFKGIHHKHKYRCKCGKESEITFAGFHHQNQNCKECGIKKNSGSNHHGWIENRDQKLLDQKFRKKCYKALESSLIATNKSKIGRTSDMLGYTPNELQEHIINHSNWKNVKDGDWHIDHIFPITAFLEHDITDIKLINCLDNLQPLSQKENNQKHGKYNKKAFKKWLNKHET